MLYIRQLQNTSSFEFIEMVADAKAKKVKEIFAVVKLPEVTLVFLLISFEFLGALSGILFYCLLNDAHYSLIKSTFPLTNA